MSDAEQRIFEREMAILSDHYCAVERIVERIEAHAPHMPARVREPWGALDLEGLATGILTGGAS